MKTLTTFIVLIVCINLSAQNNENSLQNSLQASLNKALVSENSKIDNFEANIDLSKDVVQLKWNKNASNTSTSFTIEKSIDNLSWKEVTTVSAPPNNLKSTDYFHLDNAPTENLTYYRLRSKNKNGDESYSNIVPVNYLKKEGPTAGINLHPEFSEDYKIINIAFEF